MQRGDFSPNTRLFQLSSIAFFVGAAASLVALFLVKLIYFFTQVFFFGRFSFSPISPSANHLGVAVILVPTLGGLLIGLMARFGSERIRGHGIPEALEAILFGKSIMQPKVAVLKPLSSAISIGSGGPFGAEGPIIMTGGAVGSLIGQLFHLTAAERKTLLVSGAAAGMSAIFGSPIAAVLLAVELLLFEWKPRSLVPVTIASITAAACRPYLLGAGPVFPFITHLTPSVSGLLACCAVGVIAGFFSAGTSALLYRVEDEFQRLPVHWMWWCVIGGLFVGIGGYFQPRALGVGYDVIEDLLRGNLAPHAALALLAVKSLIWVVALGSGTSGGVLAPLLIMGCGLGTVEARFLPGAYASVYPLVSMAAVMGGMMRSPFTAVIFALETTHHIDALVPTLAATIFAYSITVLVMKRSILTEKVARRGFDVFREYAVDPLELTRVEEVMSTDVISIPAHLSFMDIAERYFSAKTKFRGYPVVDDRGLLEGILTASDLLEENRPQVDLSLRANDLAREKVITIFPDQSCREAAQKMAVFGIGRLPVVSPADPRKILGMITRSDLLKPRLKEHELEMTRERYLSFAGRP